MSFRPQRSEAEKSVPSLSFRPEQSAAEKSHTPPTAFQPYKIPSPTLLRDFSDKASTTVRQCSDKPPLVVEALSKNSGRTVEQRLENSLSKPLSGIHMRRTALKPLSTDSQRNHIRSRYRRCSISFSRSSFLKRNAPFGPYGFNRPIAIQR
uniref:Uncharacterized protein n=1 Tax=Sphingobacterium sp. (strain 21) TaxID=743722 RepID=F4C996_SPHS2